MNFLIKARAYQSVTYLGRVVTIIGEIGSPAEPAGIEAPSEEEAAEHVALILRRKCPDMAGWSGHSVEVAEVK